MMIFFFFWSHYKKKVGVVFFFFSKTIRIVIRSRVKLDNSRGCIIERRVMMMI